MQIKQKNVIIIITLIIVILVFINQGGPMSTQKRKSQIPRNHHDSSDCCISPQMRIKLNSLGNGSRLVWSLSAEQITYIERNYNYSVAPYIYKIKTIRELPDTATPAILKQLQRGARAGNSHISSTLKKQDISILNELGIAYTPVKYAISKLS